MSPSRHHSAPPAPLSKEELNALPIRAYEGEITLVRTDAELKRALPRLREERILGFDTETRPTFTRGAMRPPALIQLATADQVFLIQLTHVSFDERVAELLASPDILKVGVAIHDDLRGLAAIHAFQAQGVVDLALLARQHGVEAQGLRSLAGNLLGFRISKAAQCSNWERTDLAPRQILYAATDAWIGREIYLQLTALDSGFPLTETTLPQDEPDESSPRRRKRSRRSREAARRERMRQESDSAAPARPLLPDPNPDPDPEDEPISDPSWWNAPFLPFDPSVLPPRSTPFLLTEESDEPVEPCPAAPTGPAFQSDTSTAPADGLPSAPPKKRRSRRPRSLAESDASSIQKSPQATAVEELHPESMLLPGLDALTLAATPKKRRSRRPRSAASGEEGPQREHADEPARMTPLSLAD